MVLANFTIRIQIPKWMNEPEQDECLAALEKCPLKRVVEKAVYNALAKTKRLSLSQVTVED